MAFTVWLLLFTFTFVKSMPGPQLTFEFQFENVQFESINIITNGVKDCDSSKIDSSIPKLEDGSEELQEAKEQEEIEEAEELEEKEEAEEPEEREEAEEQEETEEAEEIEEAETPEEIEEEDEPEESKEPEDPEELSQTEVVPSEFGASSSWTGYGPEKSISTDGYWYPAKATTLPAIIWFKFSNAKIVNKYSFSCKPSDEEVLPTNYTFFGSNADDCSDSSHWTTLVDSNGDNQLANPTVDSFKNTESYFCYGFKITKSAKSETYTSLSKLVLYAQAKVFPREFGASSSWSGYGPEKSISTDGGYWYTGEGTTLPATIWFKFSNAKIVKKYSFAGKPSDEEVLPTIYTFFGSNGDDCSDSSHWTTLVDGSRDNQLANPSVDSVNNNEAYFCYGFMITKSAKSETYTSLSKLSFYAQATTCADMTCGENAQCSTDSDTGYGSCYCEENYVYNGETAVPEGMDCKATCAAITCGENAECSTDSATGYGSCQCPYDKGTVIPAGQDCKACSMSDKTVIADEVFQIYYDTGKDWAVTWDAAQQKCAEAGMIVAEPKDPVAVFTYLKKHYSDPTFWLGARKPAWSKFHWVNTGELIPDDHPYWDPRSEPGGYRCSPGASCCLRAFLSVTEPPRIYQARQCDDKTGRVMCQCPGP